MKAHSYSRRLAAILIPLALLSLVAVPAQNPGKKKRNRRQLLAIPEVARDQVICFALYTVHTKTLKLTAQLYPLQEGEARSLRLEVKRDGKWTEIAQSKVIEDGWTAPFRVENWDDTKTVPYRVRHGENAMYAGSVRKNPTDKQEIVIAAFTGNSIHPAHGGDISRADLIKNVKTVDADLLFFSGDQVYDHNRHFAAWLKFGRDFGEIIKDRPTITIPDDHDVGQPNLWGHSGKKSKFGAGHDGGYVKSADYVKMVERAQTSHLPDPVDPTPVDRGIGVYFTELRWGNISFAILEDRKFKTGPSEIIPKQGPRPDHIRNPEYDPASVDVPEAILLGERQLVFLDNWGKDWTDAKLKVVLSQTIFCGGAHIHGKIGGRLHADLDSNGWPQTGRNKALDVMRRAFAFHIAGDQHLATVFHHGIDAWGDAGFSFCVPSIANLYLRWWQPLKPGKNRKEGWSPILGEHLDGFDNKLTAYAVANPGPGRAKGDRLTTRAAGFGIVRLNTGTRKITMECWPRNVDIAADGAKPYPGWPLTIDQLDNYGREAVAILPDIIVRGVKDPVVQVVDEASGEVVYTLRIKGQKFRGKVFKAGKYTVHVSKGAKKKSLKGIAAQVGGAPEAGSEGTTFYHVDL